jgi:hypothetical protein
MLGDGDTEESERVMRAMLEMEKKSVHKAYNRLMNLVNTLQYY